MAKTLWPWNHNSKPSQSCILKNIICSSRPLSRLVSRNCWLQQALVLTNTMLPVSYLSCEITYTTHYMHTFDRWWMSALLIRSSIILIIMTRTTIYRRICSADVIVTHPILVAVAAVSGGYLVVRLVKRVIGKPAYSVYIKQLMWGHHVEVIC